MPFASSSHGGYTGKLQVMDVRLNKDSNACMHRHNIFQVHTPSGPKKAATLFCYDSSFATYVEIYVENLQREGW